MRCPKCGYNSFDYLDNCKKCGKDLLEFKQRYGLRSVLFTRAIELTGVAVQQDEFSDAEAAELTGAVAAGAAMGAAAPGTAVDESIAEGDDSGDFGFDFMGDSAEDDDLSFDELFEDAPAEDDVEETLEAPKNAANDVTKTPASVPPDTPSATSEDFAFELPDAEDEDDDELEDDFGFDPAALDFEAEVDESENKDTTKGSGEGPQSPFDLPESSSVVEAPEEQASPTPGVDEESKGRERLAEATVAVATVAPAAVVTDRQSFAVPAEMKVPQDEPLNAPLRSRFVAFLYDFVVLFVVGFSFVVAGELALSSHSGPLPTPETLITFSVPYFLVLFSLTFGYFTLFHFLTGQTPGKMLTGLRVETLRGEALPFAQAFLRSVGGLLQALPLGLGYLLLLAQSDRQGWNDRFAGTRVVVVRNND